MFCRKCGADNKDNAKFCRSCGNPMPLAAAFEGISTTPQYTDGAPVKRANPNRRIYLILILIGLFLLAFGSYTLYEHLSNPEMPNIVMSDPVPPPPRPAPAPTPPEPVQPTVESEQAAATTDTAATEQVVVLVSPDAPCPAKELSCMGGPYNNTKDPSCPSYKPVWTYFSPDKGATWRSAGCYATEIDASKALTRMRNMDPAKLEKRRQELERKKAQDSAAAPVPEPQHQVVVPAPEPAAPVATHSKEYPLKFKGAFGLTVETRTYPTPEMKARAQDLWDRDRKILELDGSINEKYVTKQQEISVIPGH